MTDAKPNLLFRSDTILGVCEGIGEEFGFSPTWLRVAFAGAFYFAPLAVTATYLALGAALALARWMYPLPAAAAAPAVTALADAVPASAADHAEPLKIAA